LTDSGSSYTKEGTKKLHRWLCVLACFSVPFLTSCTHH